MSAKSKINSKNSPKKTILEQIIIAGTLTVFAILPLLYFSSRAGAAITSKEYFFIGLIDVLICAWVWLQLKDSRYRLSKKNLIVFDFLFLFLVATTISGIVGVDPRISFFSMVETGTGIIFLWHAFFFALIVASLIRVQGTSFLKKILQANLFASVVLSITTLFTNFAFDIHSVMLNGSLGGAMMGNALLAGAYFVFSIFLSLFLVSMESSRKKKVLYFVGIAIVAFGPILFLDEGIWERAIPLFASLAAHPILIFGHARTASLSIAIGLVFSFFIWLFLSARKKIFSRMGLAGAMLILATVGFGILKIATPQTKLHNLFIQDAEERPVDWQIAIAGIRERPIFGWGQDNYQIEYLQHFNPVVFDPKNGSEIYAVHPHNASLEILVNDGIVGFVLYVFVIIVFIWQLVILYREKKINAATVALFIGMMFAYLLQNQMVFDSGTSFVMFFAVMAIIAGRADSSQEFNSQKKISDLGYAVGILATAILIPAWIFFAYFPARKVTEMQTIANEPSDVRISNYNHLFHSAGSNAFTTDPEFYTLTIANSYITSLPTILSNPQYQMIAAQEIDVLLKNMDSISSEEKNDYRFALSGIELENLEITLTNSASVDRLAAAKNYFDRAVNLSPTNPDPQMVYSEIISRQNSQVK